MQELIDGMTSIVNGKDATNSVFAYPLPYNLIPQIDVFLDNKYTKEEMKVVWESKKIMDAPDMKVGQEQQWCTSSRGGCDDTSSGSSNLLLLFVCICMYDHTLTYTFNYMLVCLYVCVYEQVSCTAVRIPTLRAHSEAITLETEEKITADEVRQILSTAPGVTVRMPVISVMLYSSRFLYYYLC